MRQAIAVRPTTAADAERVRAFVHAHPEGTPFHLPQWIDATVRACRQQDCSLLAETSDGCLAAILPLARIASPLFGRALVSSGFAVGGGILALPGTPVEPLAEAALGVACTQGCGSVELRGGSSPGEAWNEDATSYLSFIRPLAESDAAELAAVPRKQRAEIRRAQTLDLTVETGTGARNRDAHYRVYAESVRNLGTPVFPRALFEAVLDDFGDQADILTVCAEGRAVASVLSLYWRGTVMPYWGGGTAEARRLRANDMMYFALMCHARSERGCTHFDFGRSKTGSGAAAFKRNWGFTGEPLRYFRRALDGGTLRDTNPSSARYRMQVALWKRLPIAIANTAGPWISRGLG